jgi:phasin family protein
MGTGRQGRGGSAWISAQAYAQAAFDSGASVLDLQLDAARTALAAATVAGNQLLSAKDPQALLQLSRTQSQLAMERIGAYGRQAKDVAQETQEKFATVTRVSLLHRVKKWMSCCRW